MLLESPALTRALRSLAARPRFPTFGRFRARPPEPWIAWHLGQDRNKTGGRASANSSLKRFL